MSYTPTEWKTGDVVTSAKLNKLEQGVADAGGAFIVGATENNGHMTLDKTWQEIWDAFVAGYKVMVVGKSNSTSTENDSSIIVSGVYYDTDAGEYKVGFGGNVLLYGWLFGPEFFTNTPNGYPEYNFE